MESKEDNQTTQNPLKLTPTQPLQQQPQSQREQILDKIQEFDNADTMDMGLRATAYGPVDEIISIIELARQNDNLKLKLGAIKYLRELRQQILEEAGRKAHISKTRIEDDGTISRLSATVVAKQLMKSREAQRKQKENENADNPETNPRTNPESKKVECIQLPDVHVEGAPEPKDSSFFGSTKVPSVPDSPSPTDTTAQHAERDQEESGTGSEQAGPEGPTATLSKPPVPSQTQPGLAR
jgi:hypothetical protein